MAILIRTNCRDKKRIQEEFYPFSEPEKIDGLIIGNDLDSLLSAAILKSKYNWDIIGVYDYTNLWYSKDISAFRRNIVDGKYLAVDLDIYHSGIPSLGHHVLENKSSDVLSGHRLTLNPNFIRGINSSNFRRKYPLGTIHFLIWLFDVDQLGIEAELLVWLADSSFINGQSHRFKSNVKEWIVNYMSSSILLKSQERIDTEEFEREIERKIIPDLQKIGLCENSGQVKSRYHKIGGFQCQWDDPNKRCAEINRLLHFICELTSWRRPKFPKLLSYIRGIRKNCSISQVEKKYGGLDRFLGKESVFSYVINFNNSINYTCMKFTGSV